MNIQSGTGPTKKDRRDFSFLAARAHKLAGLTTIPESYSVSNGLRIPNQQMEDTHFTPTVPPLPYGCTDYAQSELLAYEDGHLFNPMEIENITHANARQGCDMRTSLNTVVKLHPDHPAYFNVHSSGPVDAFDAARLAMLVTANEKRGVSVGSPFFYEWHTPDPNMGILNTPSFDMKSLGTTWHDWVIAGWEKIGNQTYLKCQMLQGQYYGKGGWVYMSRPIFNAVMAIPGSAAFTLDKLSPGEKPPTVGSPAIQAIVNFIRSLFKI